MNYVIKNAENGNVLIMLSKDGNKYTVSEIIIGTNATVRIEKFDKYDFAETWFNARCVANGITEIEEVEHDLAEFANID